jgi:GT2 family glycosyltransferase
MAEARIECVVVLYKTSWRESSAVRSLIDCCGELPGLADGLCVLIYDNSPEAQELEADEIPFKSLEYLHDSDNGGLAKAYNRGLDAAIRQNIQWLLLVDQDTLLDVAVFTALLREVATPPRPDVVALVPKLVQDGRVISPQIVGRFRNTSAPWDLLGTSARRLTALNSAACLRVQAVLDVGGFPREYWLDYLDHIMFYRLQRAGGRVMVLDATIQHRLSYLNLETEMSMERYANMLAAEWRFIRETGTGGGPLLHRLRLCKRALKLRLELKDSRYGWKTLRAAFA